MKRPKHSNDHRSRHTYRDGLITYLEVATAENAALDIERTAFRLRGQQLVAAVALVKSLGGGWKNPTFTTKDTTDSRVRV